MISCVYICMYLYIFRKIQRPYCTIWGLVAIEMYCVKITDINHSFSKIKLYIQNTAQSKTTHLHYSECSQSKVNNYVFDDETSFIRKGFHSYFRYSFLCLLETCWHSPERETDSTARTPWLGEPSRECTRIWAATERPVSTPGGTSGKPQGKSSL